MVKCHTCRNDVDIPPFKLCSKCREKSARIQRETRSLRTAKKLCSRCGKPRDDIKYKFCSTCREHLRSDYKVKYVSRRKNVVDRPPMRPNEKHVHISVACVRMIEKKAEELGANRREILSELVEKFIGEVEVW
jgi:hypothetical protein